MILIYSITGLYPLLLKITIVFVILISLISVFTLIVQVHQKLQRGKRKKVVSAFGVLIEKAILAEQESIEVSPIHEFAIPRRLQKMLSQRELREWFLHELVQAKRNLSGVASANLKRLYEQLKLYEDSNRKLNSLKWYRKALGIQELCLMGQTRYAEEIFHHTNHSNEYVRMEAQLGIITLTGMKGLRFLDGLTQEITPWNRILLLEHVSDFSYADFTEIEDWLLSPNISVILFTLKLIDIYHLFALHDKVVDALDHTSGDVKTAALATLKAIYNDSSAEKIIACYPEGDMRFRQDALSTLEVIGSAASLPFLLQQWRSDSVIVRMAAAKAIVHSSPNGLSLLEKSPDAASDPERAIIQHLKAEIKL